MRDPVSHELSLLKPQLFLNMSISVCLLPPAGFYHHSTPGFTSLPTCLPVSPLASLQSNLPTAAKLIFFFFFFLKIHLFTFWLWWVSVAARRLSQMTASRGYSSLSCGASHCSGVSCCRAQALGRRLWQLQRVGSRVLA